MCANRNLASTRWAGSSASSGPPPAIAEGRGRGRRSVSLPTARASWVNCSGGIAMSDLATKVCIVVADDLGLPGLAVTDDLVQDHGIDELGLQAVAMRLEEEFGLEDRSVSEEALIIESTVGKCVELVSHALHGHGGYEK